MKIFIKRVFIFLIPIICIGALVELLLRRIPNDYQYKSKYLNENSDSLQLLILGSSHAYSGLNPAWMKEKSFNAAYLSQSIDYDLAILKMHDKKWENLKYIILPVDYFSLYGNLKDGPEKWRVLNYDIYFGMNPHRNPFEKIEITNTRPSIYLNRIFYHYLKDSSFLSCSNLGWGKHSTATKQSDLVVTGAEAAKRHRTIGDTHFNEIANELTQLINFAEAKKIKVILYTSPCYNTYTNLLDSTQLFRTISLATTIAKKNPNVGYYNLLYDTSFKAVDYYDADHLNELGARKLSLILDSLITSNFSVK